MKIHQAIADAELQREALNAIRERFPHCELRKLGGKKVWIGYGDLGPPTDIEFFQGVKPINKEPAVYVIAYIQVLPDNPYARVYYSYSTPVETFAARLKKDSELFAKVLRCVCTFESALGG
jgi:hypothetical protein